MKSLLSLAGLTFFITRTNNKYNSNRQFCSEKSNSDTGINAICVLNPDGDSKAKGIVHFNQSSFDSPTKITGKFSNLKKNAKHGFHVHEFGDLTKGCTTAGAHYNPTWKSHGGPDSEERHYGDLGNIESDDNGEAKYEREDKYISLMGRYSVVGRALVVHENEDDFGLGGFEDSKTTGHAGPRIACGVIGLTGKAQL